MHGSFTIFPLGDSALVVDFGEQISVDINKRAHRLFSKLKAINDPVIVDLVPAYASLAVHFDPLVLQQEKLGNESSFDLMSEFIESLAMEADEDRQENTRLVQVPVCYHASMAPDLALAAHYRELEIEQFIEIHTAPTYRVYMIGFLPGFPYMGEVDERIALPRRATPRKNVPAGSVGIAGKQTGIYPLDSPGGWQVVGRTPLQIFNKKNREPVLLQPGDEVKFYSITEHEFANYQGRNS
jgi:inhibitor of KinA